MSRGNAPPTDAIVLRTLDFGETSQIVHLATPERGLVTALAKGAHALRGAFQGGIPIGVLGVAEVLPRRGELDLLRSFRVTDALRGLHDDLDRFAAGGRILGLLRDLERPGLPAPALFLAGVAALKAVSGSPPEAAPMWETVFHARALAACGHRPHLATCVSCGEDLGASAVFSAQAGGAVHARCDPGGPRVRLDAEALEGLRRLYTARLPEIAAEPPSPRMIAAARAVHAVFVPWVLGREVPPPRARRSKRR